MQRLNFPDPQESEIIGGRYQLQELLGEGTFGRVFKACDLQFEPARIVAIKLLVPQLITEPEIREGVKREASILARFNHPNILRIIDFSITGDQPYIVTELAEGGSLASKIESSSSRQFAGLPLEEVAVLLEQLADAIDEAHSEGMVHRDIKPQNILLDKRGRPLIADFGLAATLSQSQSSIMKVNPSGTPLYMAPEQWNGKAGKANDIYALGVVVFQLITGRPPYLGSIYELMGQHINAPIPTLSSKAPHLNYPAELDRIMADVMAKEDSKRIKPAREFYRRFRAVLLGGYYPQTSAGTSAENFASSEVNLSVIDYDSENLLDLKVHVSNPEKDYAEFKETPIEEAYEFPTSSVITIKRKANSFSNEHIIPSENPVYSNSNVQNPSYIQPVQAIVPIPPSSQLMSPNEGAAWRMVFNKLGYIAPKVSVEYNTILNSAGFPLINYDLETVILHIGIPKPLNFGSISATSVNCWKKNTNMLWEARGGELLITNKRVLVYDLIKRKLYKVVTYDLTNVYRFEQVETQRNTAVIFYGTETNLTLNMVLGNQLVVAAKTIGTMILNTKTQNSTTAAALQLFKAMSAKHDLDDAANSMAKQVGNLKNAFYQFCGAVVSSHQS